jgi:hypothetical protein
MPNKGHGIQKTGRNEEQPTDMERAQDSSSSRQDKEQGKDGTGQTNHPND